MGLDGGVIVAAKRTLIGSMLASLSALSVPKRSTIAPKAFLPQLGIEVTALDKVISSCVLQAAVYAKYAPQFSRSYNH